MNQDEFVNKWLAYVRSNKDRINKTITQMEKGEGILFMRNLAAEQGVELTPQEVQDAYMVLKKSLKIIEE